MFSVCCMRWRGDVLWEAVTDMFIGGAYAVFQTTPHRLIGRSMPHESNPSHQSWKTRTGSKLLGGRTATEVGPPHWWEERLPPRFPDVVVESAQQHLFPTVAQGAHEERLLLPVVERVRVEDVLLRARGESCNTSHLGHKRSRTPAPHSQSVADEE